jgi:hypothetical protein
VLQWREMEIRGRGPCWETTGFLDGGEWVWMWDSEGLFMGYERIVVVVVVVFFFSCV